MKDIPVQNTYLVSTSRKKEMIDWEELPDFQELKTRTDIQGVNPGILYGLQNFRRVYNDKILISPLKGAIVSTNGHSTCSRHKPEYGADAIDWFPLGDPANIIPTLTIYNPFGGIGFYFDTFLNGKQHLMLHTDLRPRRKNTYPTIWFRNKSYIYPRHESLPTFLANIQKEILKIYGL